MRLKCVVSNDSYPRCACASSAGVWLHTGDRQLFIAKSFEGAMSEDLVDAALLKQLQMSLAAVH